jgi:hypothetical protein
MIYQDQLSTKSEEEARLGEFWGFRRPAWTHRGTWYPMLWRMRDIWAVLTVHACDYVWDSLTCLIALSWIRLKCWFDQRFRWIAFSERERERGKLDKTWDERATRSLKRTITLNHLRSEKRKEQNEVASMPLWGSEHSETFVRLNS